MMFHRSFDGDDESEKEPRKVLSKIRVIGLTAAWSEQVQQI